jgi:hypothetical protein
MIIYYDGAIFSTSFVATARAIDLPVHINNTT